MTKRKTQILHFVFFFVREQRVSALLMAILTGLSVFFTHILGVSCSLLKTKSQRNIDFVLVYSDAGALRCFYVYGCFCITKYAGKKSSTSSIDIISFRSNMFFFRFFIVF